MATEKTPKELRQRYIRGFIKRSGWFGETYGSDSYWSRPRPYPVGNELGILTPWAGLAGAPAILPKADIVAVTWFEDEEDQTLLRRMRDLRDLLGDKCVKKTEPVLHFVVERLTKAERAELIDRLRGLEEPPLFGGSVHVKEVARQRAEMEARAEQALLNSSDSTLFEATMPTEEAIGAIDYFNDVDDNLVPLLVSLSVSIGRCVETVQQPERLEGLVRAETLPRLNDLREAAEEIDPDEDQEELHEELAHNLDELEAFLKAMEGDGDARRVKLQKFRDRLDQWRDRLEEEETILDL